MSGEIEALATVDLRIRSLDRERGEPFNTCCEPGCDVIAEWSLWFHTPDWGPSGGLTIVRCHRHALSAMNRAIDRNRHRDRRIAPPVSSVLPVGQVNP